MIQKTNDGGLICFGDGKFGIEDFSFSKIDESGNQIWFNYFGGNEREELQQIISLTDGYLLCGTSQSGISGNKSSQNYGNRDIWIVKTDLNGKLIWEKSFGGDKRDFFRSIFQDADGSLFIAGESNSSKSGDKSETSKSKNNELDNDYWIIKTDSKGNKLWDKTFGGDGNDVPMVMLKTNYDDFIVFGNSKSPNSSDKSENNYISNIYDYWLVCIDKNGNKLWDKVIGGNSYDFIFKVIFDKSTNIFQTFGVSESPVSFDKKSATNKLDEIWIANLKYIQKD